MIADEELMAIKKRCKKAMNWFAPAPLASFMDDALTDLTILIAEVERLRSALRVCHIAVAKLGTK